LGSRNLRLSEFLGNSLMKVVRLSALCTDHKEKDLTVCSAVPQPTAPPSTTINISANVKQSHYRPVQLLRDPEGSGSQISGNQHMNMVRLSALQTGRLYPPPPRKYSWYKFLLETESTPGP
jgi:hypothetical protein